MNGSLKDEGRNEKSQLNNLINNRATHGSMLFGFVNCTIMYVGIPFTNSPCKLEGVGIDEKSNCIETSSSFCMSSRGVSSRGLARNALFNSISIRCLTLLYSLIRSWRSFSSFSFSIFNLGNGSNKGNIKRR